MKQDYLPNLFTVCRVILSICLLFLTFQSFAFVLLYLICGLTDILDGYLARKLKAETHMGAKLDSLADLCMCGMIAVTIMRQTHDDRIILIGICAVFIIRIGCALFSKIKFREIAGIHTVANKLAGFLFFLCPLGFVHTGNISFYITGAVALLASAEEFFILLSSNILDVNRKSFFVKPDQNDSGT